MKFDNLNILRSIAIIAIIIGHGCLQLGFESMARWCGYLFVQVFFLLSALLLGLKYGGSPLQCSFLKKRWIRLSKVYYPFLFVSVVVLLCMGGIISWQSVFSHLFYLNYPLQTNLAGIGFGHLWYLSLLMLCYLLVQVGLCKPLYRWTQMLLSLRISVLALVLVTLAIGYCCAQVCIPCRIPIVLCSFIILFVNAKRFLVWAETASICMSVVWFVFTNFLCLVLFLNFDLNSKLLLRDSVVLMTAGSWLWLFSSAFRTQRCPHMLSWISALSFELYLVHSPFVIGEHSFLSFNPISWFLTTCIVFFLAFALHKLSHLL